MTIKWTMLILIKGWLILFSLYPFEWLVDVISLDPSGWTDGFVFPSDEIERRSIETFFANDWFCLFEMQHISVRVYWPGHIISLKWLTGLVTISLDTMRPLTQSETNSNEKLKPSFRKGTAFKFLNHLILTYTIKVMLMFPQNLGLGRKLLWGGEVFLLITPKKQRSSIR